MDFLSHAAIVGFVAGAAIVIGLQQLKGLLGITNFLTKTDIVSVMKAVWEAVHNPVCYFFLSFPYKFGAIYGGGGELRIKIGFGADSNSPFSTFIIINLIINIHKHKFKD